MQRGDRKIQLCNRLNGQQIRQFKYFDSSKKQVGKSKDRRRDNDKQPGIILGGICLDSYSDIPEPYRDYLKIGTNVYIKTGTILCGEGFHFSRDDRGTLKFNEHKKGLVIRDNVWIGSNCTIDRGRIRPTVVGGGTKIDNGVHISHNCRIGRNCILGTGSIILGSVEIGDGSEIWSGAIIHQHVKIGKNCAVGAGTYLRKDLPDNTVAYIDNRTGKLVIKPISETKKYSQKNTEKNTEKIGRGGSRKSCLNGKCSIDLSW